MEITRSAVQCTNHYAPASLHEQTEEGGVGFWLWGQWMHATPLFFDE